MNAVTVTEGTGRVILALPHAGTAMPPAMRENLTLLGRQMPDTDWHVDRLYEGLLPSATIVRANFSRYVIDPNRPPDGVSLYPGQNSTELVPNTTFDGTPIWNSVPGSKDISHRLQTYHAPYHRALHDQVERVRHIHGGAVVYDCHSIRSEVPFLFEGRLPDLNIGDNRGTSCSPEFTEAVAAECQKAPHYTHVVNGRFRGGWTTRHYGNPDAGVHAIQMELSQRCYLDSESPPFDYSEPRAEALRTVLKSILRAVEETAKSIL